MRSSSLVSLAIVNYLLHKSYYVHSKLARSNFATVFFLISQQRTIRSLLLLDFFDFRWQQNCCVTRMAKLERVRDFFTAPPQGEYFRDKQADGWKLVAIEWERGAATAPEPIEEIPFGLRVASDCRQLEENPDEVQVLLMMMEVLVQDGPLSQAAKLINDRGYRQRDGQTWTRTALFYLLPRLIEVGPRLCTSDEWVERRKHLFNVG